jgi:hypothetical protein
MPHWPRFGCFVIALFAALPSPTFAATVGDRYEIGNPKWKDLWVDPAKGSDENSGKKPEKPFRTLQRALNEVLGDDLRSAGFRIKLLPGHYPPFGIDGLHGTARAPVMIEAASGAGSVIFDQRSSIFRSEYVYLIGLHIRHTRAANVLQISDCKHILLRELRIESYGDIPSKAATKEGLKVNQCQYVYVEDSDFSGAWENSVDYVAVQHGHLLHNRIHDCGDWTIYTKGGSAYLRIEGNELYNSPVGGFIAGEGTGFEYLVSPWLHWEAYHIEFVNNYVHDTPGAGMAVGGGYNILFAYNTLYRVGKDTAAIAVLPGEHSCDAHAARCVEFHDAGGWGSGMQSHENPDHIPARNVSIVNNLVYNPAGWEGKPPFRVAGPRQTAPGANIPNPVVVDENLQIKGNVIWTGSGDALGVEAADSGCAPSNPTCNAAQLRADNQIGGAPPKIVSDPSGGMPVLATGGNAAKARTAPLPKFPAAGRQLSPAAPDGELAPSVTRDLRGAPRGSDDCPGALLPPSAGAPRL